MEPNPPVISVEDSGWEFQKRILLGIPMTGLIRAEWHLHFLGLVIPCNWAHGTYAHIFDHYSPIRFLVADARNLIAQRAVEFNYEWLLFIDHDVLMPPNAYIILNEYMRDAKIPIVGGLYFTKSTPAEPLIYRGRGNSFYQNWKVGDKVWVDGMGLGFHLIHGSVLKVMYEESEEYQIKPGVNARRIFESPAFVAHDPELQIWAAARGTEDLPWYDRIVRDKILKKAGWPKIARKKYPFLCDTNLLGKHINNDGTQYPAHGELKDYQNDGKDSKPSNKCS